MRLRPAAVTALLAVALAAGSPLAAAQAPRSTEAACPDGIGSAGFADVEGSVHRRSIDCVVHWEVAQGRSPRSFAPTQVVNRGQAASFVARLLERSGAELPEPSGDTFADDDASVHEASIERLAAAGVVKGHSGDRFAPEAPMTRAQAAALVVRAHDLRARQAGAEPLPPGEDAFPDDEGAVLEPDIDRAAAAGIVGGDASGRYHPGSDITREGFASVLARTLDVLVASGLAQVPPAPVRPVTVVAAGDIACRAGEPVTQDACQHAATARVTQSLDPEAVLLLGDIQYPDGSVAQFTEQGGWTGTWSALLDRSWPAPGNHEWDTEGAAGYRHVFDGRTGGRFWYSFDLGPWHVVSLDSDCEQVGGCGEGSAQHEWFEQDLAAHDGRQTLVFWHHPRFSGGNGDHPAVDDLWRTAAGDRDVQLLLAGHDHSYVGCAPPAAAGAPDAAGLRTIVVGTGGKSLDCDRPPSTHSAAFGCSSHGVLRLQLRPDGYDWEFVRASGDFADAGSAGLRPAA